MKRLFIALDIPDTVRVSLGGAVGWMAGYKKSVKVVPPENYHVTLKFLGSVPDEKVPAIREALERAAGFLFAGEVHLDVWGMFPEKGRPQVFWAGFEPAEALRPMAERIETEMQTLGFAKEVRSFQSHVTLARSGDGPAPPAFIALWNDLPSLAPSTAFRANTVTLYESQTLPSGPVYQPVSSIHF